MSTLSAKARKLGQSSNKKRSSVGYPWRPVTGMFEGELWEELFWQRLQMLQVHAESDAAKPIQERVRELEIELDVRAGKISPPAPISMIAGMAAPEPISDHDLLLSLDHARKHVVAIESEAKLRGIL